MSIKTFREYYQESEDTSRNKLRAFFVPIMGNFYGGRYYEYTSIPAIILALNPEDAKRIAEKKLEDVLEWFDKRKSKNGKRFIPKDWKSEGWEKIYKVGNGPVKSAGVTSAGHKDGTSLVSKNGLERVKLDGGLPVGENYQESEDTSVLSGERQAFHVRIKGKFYAGKNTYEDRNQFVVVLATNADEANKIAKSQMKSVMSILAKQKTRGSSNKKLIPIDWKLEDYEVSNRAPLPANISSPGGIQMSVISKKGIEKVKLKNGSVIESKQKNYQEESASSSIKSSKKKIKFNKDNKKLLSIGEALRPIAKITTKEEAKQYFADYVKYMKTRLAKKPHENGMTAEQICKSNIGYYARYFDPDTTARIYKLFDTKNSKSIAVQEESNHSLETEYGIDLRNGAKRPSQAQAKKALTQTSAVLYARENLNVFAQPDSTANNVRKYLNAIADGDNNYQESNDNDLRFDISQALDTLINGDDVGFEGLNSDDEKLVKRIESTLAKLGFNQDKDESDDFVEKLSNPQRAFDILKKAGFIS